MIYEVECFVEAWVQFHQLLHLLKYFTTSANLYTTRKATQWTALTVWTEHIQNIS